MSDRPKSPVVAGKPQAVRGSDAAPVIYFDGVLAWGVHNNVLQIEVACNQLVPADLSSGPLKTRVVVTGHLRCSATAAKQLSEVLDHALEIDGPPDKKSAI
jgi:hypothetical protein